jgi:hypothetical protein
VGIAFSYDNSIQDVAFGKYAEQLAAVIEHANCANVSLGHKLGGFLHGGSSSGRVRLAVANYIAYQHRLRLLNLLWVWVLYPRLSVAKRP